jgi:hypothetical protein
MGPVRMTWNTLTSLEKGFLSFEPFGPKVVNSVIALDEGQDIIAGLYQSPVSRQSVIDFFTRFTQDSTLTILILDESVKKNVPPALAFAVCQKESNFSAQAVNFNPSSIDRGLFQLNNTSFPALSEADFFNPKVNVAQGIGYLRFCLDYTGDTALALAWYNCGPGQASVEIPAMTREYMRVVLRTKMIFEQTFRDSLVELETDFTARKLGRPRLVYLTDEPQLNSVGSWLLY